MNLQDPIVLIALAVAAILIYRRWSAGKATPAVATIAAPLGPVQHEGHVLYSAFEACKASAIGDTLKATLGQHGAGLFMNELGQAVTGNGPVAASRAGRRIPKSVGPGRSLGPGRWFVMPNYEADGPSDEQAL